MNKRIRHWDNAISSPVLFSLHWRLCSLETSRVESLQTSIFFKTRFQAVDTVYTVAKKPRCSQSAAVIPTGPSSHQADIRMRSHRFFQLNDIFISTQQCPPFNRNYLLNTDISIFDISILLIFCAICTCITELKKQVFPRFANPLTVADFPEREYMFDTFCFSDCSVRLSKENVK